MNNNKEDSQADNQQNGSSQLEEGDRLDDPKADRRKRNAEIDLPEVQNNHAEPQLRRAEDRQQPDHNFLALTEINRLFQSQNSEHGFLRAQNDVNEALAEKEIRLNKRFVLVSVIGSGGMGTVYKARDLRKVEAQDANPYVAVKVLNSDFREHPDAFMSLQREASRSHILSHPNIVTVHDFDRDGNTIYMTMELLQGEALDSYLLKHKKKGVPKNTALKIFSQLCRALAFAHQKGIIHSDLKPANIFVSDQGVKILDFGIARLAKESQLKDQFDAGTIGAITPAYASLEMLEREEPDASDDVYAAAIIAYELLVGHHPFQRKSAVAAMGLRLEPRRIENLSKRQWRAMSEALNFRRSDRTKSIKEFHLGLTESFSLPVFKVISVVLLMIVSWFSYVEYFSPDELAQVITDTMQKAELCFEEQDFTCAIGSAEAVLKIAPEHEQAKRLSRRAGLALQNQLEELEVQEWLRSAETCLVEQEYECALNNAVKVQEQKPGLARATTLINEATAAIEGEQRAEEAKMTAFSEYLSSATDCFERKKYDCAIKQANLALSVNNRDSNAEAVVRNATYAQAQQQENLKKANKILKDGQECFKKLNYSCAIAKSESALEFVPGLRAAIILKRDAEKAIEKAKKTIQIE